MDLFHAFLIKRYIFQSRLNPIILFAICIKSRELIARGVNMRFFNLFVSTFAGSTI
jgi:hypothetical protein